MSAPSAFFQAELHPTKNNPCSETLVACGIVRKEYDGLKVLGNGELTKQLNVEAKIFTASAKEKIEAAGGKAEVK